MEQLERVRAHLGVEALGEHALRDRRGRVVGRAESDRGADRAQPRAQRRALRQDLAHAREPRQACCDRAHRGVEGALAPRLPRRAQARHAHRPVGVEHRLDRAQQRQLLHPGARERVERQDHTHVRIRRQMRLPARDLRRLDRGLARCAELVEEDDDGLADPREQVHLGPDVARGRRLLGRVDEIEHHVGLVADVAQRLLRRPERALAPAVPDLAHEPADRLRRLAQALDEAARCRRIPVCPRAAAARSRPSRASYARRRTR